MKAQGSLHQLKTHPEYFARLVSGEKTFEAREDDRGFQVGDTLYLREWSPETGYTGRAMFYGVSWILRGPWSPPGWAGPGPAVSEGLALLALEFHYDEIETTGARSDP